MAKIKKHKTKRWEISIAEFRNNIGSKFKATRRIPEMSVAETKVFSSKKRARKQFNDWLK